MAGPNKKYYSIGEVSKLLGLDAPTLRYWEMEFETLQPKRNKAGNRIYAKHDIDFLKRVHYLIHEVHYTHEGAKQALRREKMQYKETEALLELRSFLKEIQQNL